MAENSYVCQLVIRVRVRVRVSYVCQLVIDNVQWYINTPYHMSHVTVAYHAANDAPPQEYRGMLLRVTHKFLQFFSNVTS